MYVTDQGKLSSMLVSWTNLANEDIFLQVSGGRSWFRPEDLIELAMLIQKRKAERQ